MRKTLVLLLVVLMILFVGAMFVSCGGETVRDDVSCVSLSNDIVLSLDSNTGVPVFEVNIHAGGDSVVAREEQERLADVATALNSAIKDRPDFANMLKGEASGGRITDVVTTDEDNTTSGGSSGEYDSVPNVVPDDGGNNDHVYEGSESFFKKLQAFANKNYTKAKQMFPGMTCEEFYHCSAVGYAVANHNPKLFKTPYVEFLKSSDVKTFVPSFDQLMSCAFWTSYCSERFGIDYDYKDIPLRERFQCENLNSDASFELAMLVEMATKESLMNGDIAVGKKNASGDRILSRFMTNSLMDQLKDIGINCVSTEENDYFSQIGNIAVYFGLKLAYFKSKLLDLSIGHILNSSLLYLKMLDHSSGIPFLTASNNFNEYICNADWDLYDWIVENYPY